MSDELIKRARSVTGACDPECQGRCKVCPAEVITELADALERVTKERDVARFCYTGLRQQFVDNLDDLKAAEAERDDAVSAQVAAEKALSSELARIAVETDERIRQAEAEAERLRIRLDTAAALLETARLDRNHAEDEQRRLQKEVERLRKAAAQYQWLRERIELRPLTNVYGDTKPALFVRVGCAYPESRVPPSSNPEYRRQKSEELDAAIAAALEAK